MKQHLLDRRMQLLLDDERYRKLAFHARRRSSSVAAVIRELIDRLPSEEEQRRREEALEALLGAEPMPVPEDPEDLDREIEEAHMRRLAK